MSYDKAKPIAEPTTAAGRRTNAFWRHGNDEYERGYAAAIADVVAWLRKTGDWFSDITDNGQCEHGNWSWEGCETCGLKGVADAIERGEAKGAANEDGEA